MNERVSWRAEAGENVHVAAFWTRDPKADSYHSSRLVYMEIEGNSTTGWDIRVCWAMHSLTVEAYARNLNDAKTLAITIGRGLRTYSAKATDRATSGLPPHFFSAGPFTPEGSPRSGGGEHGAGQGR